MNLVSIMNEAWSINDNCSVESAINKACNLMSHAYAKCYDIYTNRLNFKSNITYIAFNKILIALMGGDGEYLQGEYDLYCKFCNYMGFAPFGVSKVKETYREMTPTNIANCVGVISKYRYEIQERYYEAMVLGLCLMAFRGDQVLDENEYYIIRCFLDGRDYCPSTWQQFSKEW